MNEAAAAPGGAIRRWLEGERRWKEEFEPPLGPDDPDVIAYADFGLSRRWPRLNDEALAELNHWRDNLRVPANSAFLDGTLIMTVDALLGPSGPEILTPVTLWELTTFVDALVCFERLYCIESPAIDVARLNRHLGADVISVVPDPAGGMLRRIAAAAARDGLGNMHALSGQGEPGTAWGDELRAVVDGWRTVLGPDLPATGPFDIKKIDVRLAQMDRPAATSRGDDGGPDDEYDPESDPSALLIDGAGPVGRRAAGGIRDRQLRVLVEATRLEQTPTAKLPRPPLKARIRLASSSTYRTYVNQAVANALALPYVPGTLRMPFRRLFVERAAEIQDELVSVALADRIFAAQQPSAPLTLPFFTTTVLSQASTREDIWAQMAHARDRSAAFRSRRAELDRLLERSEVSPEALRIQAAIRDEALRLADVAGAAQQATSVALGVVAQTGIVPLTGAIKTGIDAAEGLGRDGAWTRIWRRLFHRHEYFLAESNTQALALTNAMPQLQRLWEMPRTGGYLKHFAASAQQVGHVLRD